MKVAFASCSSYRGLNQKTQPIWGIIRQQKPDLLLLLGDNVYLGKDGYQQENLKEKMGMLEEKYTRQLGEEHFEDLLSEIPFLAVWDNHDFGLPGAEDDSEDDPGTEELERYGADVSDDFRRASTDIFNRKIKSLPMSIKKPAPVVYCTHTILDCGKRIKYYMVDVRSMQEDPKKIVGPFPDTARAHTLLGHEQEKWLLNEIAISDADIDVISSGLPYSSWKKYKRWHSEFEKAISTRPKVMFLAGQVHHNTFQRHKLDYLHTDPKSNFFYEVISSGVGQSYHKEPENANQSSDELPENPNLIYRSRNNYGIIDFLVGRVIVTLYGQSADNMHYAIIDRSDWKVKKQYCMQEKKP